MLSEEEVGLENRIILNEDKLKKIDNQANINCVIIKKSMSFAKVFFLVCLSFHLHEAYLA